MFRSGNRRVSKPVYQDLGRRLQEPLAMLASCEAHAESVEAVVFRELTRELHSSQKAMGRVG